MKIAGIDGKMTKDNLISAIRRSKRAKNVTLDGAKLRYGGKVLRVRGRMIGKRACDTLKRDDIRAVARGLGLSIDASLKKSEMCDAIQRFAKKATSNQKAMERELRRAFANNN
jgi:predicted DNA binding protein